MRTANARTGWPAARRRLRGPSHRCKRLLQIIRLYHDPRIVRCCRIVAPDADPGLSLAARRGAGGPGDATLGLTHHRPESVTWEYPSGMSADYWDTFKRIAREIIGRRMPAGCELATFDASDHRVSARFTWAAATR